MRFEIAREKSSQNADSFRVLRGEKNRRFVSQKVLG